MTFLIVMSSPQIISIGFELYICGSHSKVKYIDWTFVYTFAIISNTKIKVKLLYTVLKYHREFIF